VRTPDPLASAYELSRPVRFGAPAVVFAFLAVFPLLFTNPTVTQIGVFTMMFLLAVAGWNIFSGYTGYISIGHAAFYGLGQYTVALLVIHLGVTPGWQYFALLPAAGLVAAIIGIPIGFLLLRVRRHTFIVLTIAIMFIGQLLAFNLRSFTNGSQGLEVPSPTWSGQSFNEIFYYVTFGCALVAIAVSWWVRRSRYGLSLLSIRDDEERARGLGIRTTSMKLSAFVLSAFFVGVAGGIYALLVGSVYPQFGFDPNYDLAIAVMAFTGGLGTVVGPIVGVLLLEPLQQYFLLQFGGANLFLIVYGALFLLILRLLPAGIVPTLSDAWRRWVSRNRLATGPPASAGPEVAAAVSEPVTIDPEAVTQ
jgi:branched-chain amino acid transport system permease protein